MNIEPEASTIENTDTRRRAIFDRAVSWALTSAQIDDPELGGGLKDDMDILSEAEQAELGVELLREGFTAEDLKKGIIERVREKHIAQRLQRIRQELAFKAIDGYFKVETENSP